MRRDWLQAATDAIRRNDHRNTLAGAVAGVGAAIAIGAMEWFSLAAHYPLVIIPFATSIVLVIGSPEAEPAQPRALIGGHVVATLAGLAMLQVTGPRCNAPPQWIWLLFPYARVTGNIPPACGSIRCWWFPTTFPGHSCSRRCSRARCVDGLAHVWHRWIAAGRIAALG